ncbi:Alpha/Beta hydrolase protein [Ochromonadaceae sp. CCMP2298]|nr:Alpha/Beta hydrolase protein [Ochromonadaceae sp. CCMP2298]
MRWAVLRILALACLSWSAGGANGWWPDFFEADYSEGLEEAKGIVYTDFISWIPDSLVDLRLKNSLRDLISLVDKVLSRIDRAPTHPTAVNLALLRLYALQNQTIIQNLNVGSRISISDEFAAEANLFFQYAVKAYSAQPAIIKDDILLNNLQDGASNIKMPRYVISLDHLARRIVVSVRGTASFSDIMTDLYIEASPFLEPHRGLFAHHGMAESAEALLQPVTDVIRSVWRKKIYSKYRVVVTGHSLGAGTACLLALLLSTRSQIASQVCSI